MAFDIAVIQDKYGVDEEFARGNDTYVLKDVDAAGTFYGSIWDTGGTDQITYGGARDTTVDLRAATLKYEAGGGGFVSFAARIFGGYTIANGVTIENARTGSGNDMLIGNDVANLLDGGAGTDRLEGGRGDDTYGVTTGDMVIERAGQGYDIVYANSSFALTAGQAADWASTGRVDPTGNEFNNRLLGNAGGNVLIGGGGADFLAGFGGNDAYYVDSGDVAAEGANGGSDIVYASADFGLDAAA